MATAREERASFKINKMLENSETQGSDGESSSDEEMDELRQIFSTMDTENTGFITLESMVALEKKRAHQRGSVFDAHRTKVELREFLMEADLDENHMLDFDEFVNAMKSREDPEMVPYNRSNRSLSSAGRAGARSRAKREREARKLRLKYSLKPQELKTEEEKAQWEAVKAEVVDISQPAAEAQLQQIFDGLDKNNAGLINVEQLVEVQRKVAERIHAQFDESKVREDISRFVVATDDAGGVGANEMSYDEFVEAVNGQGMTNGHLRTMTEVLWEDMQTQGEQDRVSYNDLKASLEQIRTDLKNNKGTYKPYTPVSADKGARAGGANAAGGAGGKGKARPSSSMADFEINDEFETNERETPATPAQLLRQNESLNHELKRCQEQLETTMGLADSMLAKYDKATGQITTLEKEISDLQVKLRGAEAANGIAPSAGSNPRATSLSEQKRSHKERNQEFFFLTALSIKLEIEAKYKARGLRPPGSKSTKQLYEEGMKLHVPFQFYHKFLRLQLDPVVKSQARAKQQATAEGQKGKPTAVALNPAKK